MQELFSDSEAGTTPKTKHSSASPGRFDSEPLILDGHRLTLTLDGHPCLLGRGVHFAGGQPAVEPVASSVAMAPTVWVVIKLSHSLLQDLNIFAKFSTDVLVVVDFGSG